MFKKNYTLFFVVIALLSCVPFYAWPEKGQTGWVWYNREWTPIYESVFSMPIEKGAKYGRSTSRLNGDLSLQFCQNELLGTIAYGSCKDTDWLVAEKLSRTCITAFVATAVGTVSTVATVTVINKYFKKDINKKKAAILAGSGILVATALYYALWGPYIIFPARTNEIRGY